MAQDVRWLDNEYFAVGRWDGSLDIFRFNPQESLGPRIRTSVSSPSAQGVQMITRLSSRAFVSSNDAGSMIIWRSSTDGWEALDHIAQLDYNPTFGAATGGDSFTIGPKRYLVVGHSEGYLTIWASEETNATALQFVTSANLRSAHPVNPFGLHSIHDVYMVQTAGSTAALAVTGSENGEVCFVRVPDGSIVSRTVFNPSAQRGINSIAVRDRNLLVANCSVGSHDKTCGTSE